MATTTPVSGEEYQKSYNGLPKDRQDLLNGADQTEGEELNSALTLKKKTNNQIIEEIINEKNTQQSSTPESAKPQYRHQVPESDPTVQFLSKLEERYKNNSKELDLVKNIIITPDHILIAGEEIKRVNEEAPENTKKGIYKSKKQKLTLWKWQPAMDYTKEQDGYKCLSDPEWQKVSDAIPGKSDGEHSRNGIAILGFNLAGCRDTDGDFFNEGYLEDVWSSSPNGGSGAFYRCFHRDGGGVGRGSLGRACGFSLRLAKDKKSD